MILGYLLYYVVHVVLLVLLVVVQLLQLALPAILLCIEHSIVAQVDVIACQITIKMHLQYVPHVMHHV